MLGSIFRLFDHSTRLLHQMPELGKTRRYHGRIVDGYGFFGGKPQNQERHRDPMVHMSENGSPAADPGQPGDDERIAAAFGFRSAGQKPGHHGRKPVAFLDPEFG